MNIWHLISVFIFRIVKEFGKVGIMETNCKGNKDNDRAYMTRIDPYHRYNTLGKVNNWMMDTIWVHD